MVFQTRSKLCNVAEAPLHRQQSLGEPSGRRSAPTLSSLRPDCYHNFPVVRLHHGWQSLPGTTMSEPVPKSIPAAGEEESSAPQVLEDLVHQAERANASDIHLQMRSESALVSFRLDGVMTAASEIPASLAERVFGRIKFLARLKTYQESLPQDGRIDKTGLKARRDIPGFPYPTVTGEKNVFCLFCAAQVLGLCWVGRGCGGGRGVVLGGAGVRK